MIKKPENPDNLCISVYLKDGTSYLEKDIPPQPFGKNDTIVSFWYNDKLVGIPMSEVSRVELIFR
jgi:hypothetical protein